MAKFAGKGKKSNFVVGFRQTQYGIKKCPICGANAYGNKPCRSCIANRIKLKYGNKKKKNEKRYRRISRAKVYSGVHEAALSGK